jgi:hypothetical protein
MNLHQIINKNIIDKILIVFFIIAIIYYLYYFKFNIYENLESNNDNSIIDLLDRDIQINKKNIEKNNTIIKQIKIDIKLLNTEIEENTQDISGNTAFIISNDRLIKDFKDQET